MLVWGSVIAWAAPVGYWHPDDLAALSARYAATSERLQGPFADRSDDLESAARALREYREGLDLLGERAPATERERLERLEQQFQRESATLQAFADAVVEDYDREFRAAVDRAVAKKGEVAECQATLRTGPALPGVPGQTKPNPACTGRDLNAELAKAVDGDELLTTSLDEILGRPWPEVTLDVAAQAPIGSGVRWLSARGFVAAGARGQLQAIDRADDEARTSLEAAIESGASVEELRKLEPEAERIEAQTAARRAALGGPLFAVAEARMAKWTDAPATGWCANPAPLGGCTGEDGSRAAIDRLLADKKVTKAFGGR